MDRLLTPTETAHLLGLSDRKRPNESLRYLRRTGRLRGILVAGRWVYSPRDVEAFIRSARRSR